MKILLISFEFPPQPGGIGTYSYQIAQNLSKLGEDITILTHSNGVSERDVIRYDSSVNLKIIRFKSSKVKLLRIIFRIILTWQIINQKDFDLVFITYSNAGILAYWLKVVKKIRYAIVGHGSEFLNKNIIQNFIIKIVYRKADLMISNSNYTTSLIKKMNPNCRDIKTIPLGADDNLYDWEKYKFVDWKKKHNYSNHKILLTVGNLLLRKGHKVVIEAIAQLKHDIPNILYLIVGKGPEERNLKRFIEKLELQNHVKLEGYIGSNELIEYYAMCDAFILNSTTDKNGNTEGFGIVLIEAALMAKPVIGTTDCGIEDAIEDQKNGFLIPMDNPNATAQALKILLLDQDLARKMGEYGYHRAKENYTWLKIALKTQTAFRQLESKL